MVKFPRDTPDRAKMGGLQFETAQLGRVLDDNERTKYVALLVSMASEKHPHPVDTVILAEKTSFDNPFNLPSLFAKPSPDSPSLSCIEEIESNDIYHRFLLKANGQAAVKLQVIHPATPKHIAKYTKQSRHFVAESPKAYRQLVEPYIAGNPASRLQWVQNILDGTSEVESRIHYDPDPRHGFFLLYDSKWDRRNLAGLYLLAIAKDPAIRSLRDLTAAHLPLLKGIREAAHTAVPKQFPGMAASQLRCFIHYQPTYYHFHVHIVHADMDGVGALVGQAHLLDDVIDNIETFGSDYYQKKTLHYTLGSEHPLYHAFSNAN
jgi:m7GpppX diphosphatase